MIKGKNYYLVVGQLSLAVSILLNHFLKDNNAVSFGIGFFTGLSIVMNIAFLIGFTKEEREKKV